MVEKSLELFAIQHARQMRGIEQLLELLGFFDFGGHSRLSMFLVKP